MEFNYGIVWGAIAMSDAYERILREIKELIDKGGF